MSEGRVPLRDRFRGVLRAARFTPLHPQWLVNLSQRDRTSWVGLRAKGDTLDVGCADGAIRASCPAVTRYVGLDYPVTGRDLYGARPSVYGDASKLPIADGSFDTVMLLDVAEHLADPSAAFREAARVLRRGGVLLLTVPFAYPLHDQPHDYQRFTEHGLRKRLELSGFGPITNTEVGDAVSSAAATFAMSISQGAIDAIGRSRWTVLGLPLVALVVVCVNIVGWLASRVIPAWGFMPGGYYVQATYLG